MSSPLRDMQEPDGMTGLTPPLELPLPTTRTSDPYTAVSSKAKLPRIRTSQLVSEGRWIPTSKIWVLLVLNYLYVLQFRLRPNIVFLPSPNFCHLEL